MTFANPLVLYTTEYGWTLYNLLWSLFAGVGIALYPFLKMIYDNWRGAAAEASSVATVGIGSLQRMKWSFAFKLLVFLLCVLPITDLKMKEAKYVKACDGKAHVEKAFGDTGSTWDDMPKPVAIDSGIRVPVLFHLVMQLAAGTNRAVINGMPCIADVAELDRQLRSVVLPDPQLKGEYDRFVSSCYLRARSKLYDTIRNPTKYPVLYDFLDKKLESLKLEGENPEYYDEMDSDVYDAPGLYKPCNNAEDCGNSLQARKTVDGFAPKTGVGQRDAAMPEWQAEKGAGQPYCDEWWASLRPRLIANVKLRKPIDDGTVVGITDGLLEYLKAGKEAAGNFIDWTTKEDEELEEMALRAMVRSIPVDFSGIYEPSLAEKNAWRAATAQSGTGMDALGGWAQAFAGGAGFILASTIPGVGDIAEAAASQFAGFYAALWVVKAAAPMMQALVLMLIYGLLPLYLIFSEYKPSSAITALVLVFVVSIFTLVFELADHLHQTMFAALYPDMSLWGTINTLGPKVLVLDAMLLMLYVVGPALLLYLVTMAGQGIAHSGSAGGRGIDKASTVGGGVGGAAGRAGRNVTRSMRQR